MPRRKKKYATKKAAQKAVYEFYLACLSPDFQMFNAKHYLDLGDGYHKVLNVKLANFHQPTADLLRVAFTHWIKTYHGEAFEALVDDKNGTKF
jgi:hypothetical protein